MSIYVIEKWITLYCTVLLCNSSVSVFAHIYLKCSHQKLMLHHFASSEQKHSPDSNKWDLSECKHWQRVCQGEEGTWQERLTSSNQDICDHLWQAQCASAVYKYNEIKIQQWLWDKLWDAESLSFNVFFSQKWTKGNLMAFGLKVKLF